MATNITAAVLAVLLVGAQLYFMGLYDKDAHEDSNISKNVPTITIDKTFRTGSLLNQKGGLLLDYDLSSSLALKKFENKLQ